MRKETFVGSKSLLDLAKSILQPIECEWGDCASVMNSWNSLLKHQQLHCKESRAKDGLYRCKFAKCVNRWHSTIPALQSHIEHGHMSNIFLPCPIKGCDAKVASSAYLLTHLEDEHALSEHSALVVPDLASWSNRAALCSPIKPESPPLPPPLPTRPVSCVISPCAASAKRKSRMARLRSVSQSRPTRKRTLDGKVYEDMSKEATIVFDDLPRAATAIQNDQDHDIVIQKKHPELEYQLAYPQSMIGSRVPVIPYAVGFEILAQQYPEED